MAYDSPFSSPYFEYPKPTAAQSAGTGDKPRAQNPESVWTEEITEDNFPPDRPVRIEEPPVGHSEPVVPTQAEPQVVQHTRALEDLFIDEESSVKNILRIGAASVVVLLLIAAGAFFYFRDEQDKSPQPSQTEEVPGLIYAKKGGTVTYTDANGSVASIIIPKNALAQDTRIEIRRVAVGKVTDRYRLLPDGTTFLKPITIVIPYKESVLKEDEKPEDIKLKYWLSVGSAPKDLEYTVDLENKKLRAQLTAF